MPWSAVPLDIASRVLNAAFIRRAWSAPQAIYVGFKGGDNAAYHSHMDLSPQDRTARSPDRSGKME
jgi:hypothetical protein